MCENVALGYNDELCGATIFEKTWSTGTCSLSPAALLVPWWNYPQFHHGENVERRIKNLAMLRVDSDLLGMVSEAWLDDGSVLWCSSGAQDIIIYLEVHNHQLNQFLLESRLSKERNNRCLVLSEMNSHPKKIDKKES